MGSPKRPRRDQERRTDIKDRLQALASTSSESKKPSSSLSSRLNATRPKDSDRSRKDRGEKNSRRKESPDRSKTEVSHRWRKKSDEDAKTSERWGHSGFKELYKNELEMEKNRRSRSREKTSAHRSRSYDRRNRSSGGNQDRDSRKRSRSSSDRSPFRRSTSDRKRTNSNNGATASNAKTSVKPAKKPDERRRIETLPTKKSASRNSLSPSPRHHQGSLKAANAKQKPDSSSRKRSFPESSTQRRRSRSRSKASPSSTARLKRRPPRASLSDRSSSSRSQSRSSLSSSSSSTSSGSSSSSNSPERSDQRRRVEKQRRVNEVQRLKVKSEENSKKAASSLTAGKSAKKRADSEPSSNSSSSDSGGVDEGEEDDDDGEEDGGIGYPPDEAHRSSSSGQPSTKMSLSERFGKLAQLSSQRARNLDELVQLRIVAPVGSSEKNVSIDETKAAPVIFGSGRSSSRDRSLDRQPLTTNHHRPRHLPGAGVHLYEEPIRKDERARDDRWREWHERYDQYRHVQPPRQLPRDWDDINVRHKYYTERGYFDHDMTLEDLSRWEDWWHRYQTWRRGYENAWIEMHGPDVPVEYPVEYRSGYVRDPVSAHRLSIPSNAAPPSGPTPSIRSRLGWRR